MTDKPTPTLHYGIYVAPDTPITGVVNANAAEWLCEEFDSGVNLSYLEALDNFNANPDEFAEYGIDNEDDFNDSYEEQGDTHLIGGWILQDDGQYIPDTESEYSAIVGEIYAQVVHSQFVERCALCSPCYPGQADIGNDGKYLAYTLPLSIWGDGIEIERKDHIRLQTALYQSRRLHEVTRRFLKRQEPARYLKSILAQVEKTIKALSE